MSSRRCAIGARALGVRVSAVGAATLLACTGSYRADQAAVTEAYRTTVPRGLDLVAPAPEGNLVTPAKVALGKRLFFDPILSRDGDLSCTSCHQPGLYFTDGRTLPVGSEGRVGSRNVPSILNAAYGRAFLWDGRAASIEEQVLGPIQGDAELALSLAELMRRLEADERYPGYFRTAFGRGRITPDRVAQALASYVRTLRSGDSPLDRFLDGDADALSPGAREGFGLFVGKANCGTCHLAPLFTDHDFHNTGVSWGSSDRGRYSVTGLAEDRGRFKTPSLRNVAMTAPYMHDGSIATLAEVVEHYDRGGGANPGLDSEIRPLDLTPDEKTDLISFLEALTAEPPLE
jgi:cytochrome c peroxidase